MVPRRLLRPLLRDTVRSVVEEALAGRATAAELQALRPASGAPDLQALERALAGVKDGVSQVMTGMQAAMADLGPTRKAAAEAQQAVATATTRARAAAEAAEAASDRLDQIDRRLAALVEQVGRR